MWPIETPSTQGRSSASQKSLSPQSFSLHPECINYLTCNFCTEPFSDYVFSCPQHPDVKICTDCYRRKISCFHCKRELQRSLQIEEMLGMISITCGICATSFRMNEYSVHRPLCESKGKYVCAFEIGENKCSYCSERPDILFSHYLIDHRVMEYNSLGDSIVLPHVQLHFNLREIEKPFKTVTGLPSYTSIWALYLLNFQGTRILLEFLYRIPSRSFFFIARSEKSQKIQLQMLVPRNSVYGISMGLQKDEIETKEGKSIPFSDNIPLHMHANNMIRSICAFEIDIFDMYEKYSMIHGDCRFSQFGLKMYIN
jgi:hypothetical protein